MHSRQDESRSKRLRGSSSPDHHSHINPNANLNPSNDYALPAAAARAAARVFQMAADLSLDDQGLRERLSGMRNAAMSALAGGGGGGGGLGFEGPEPHRILEAATSAERAVHAAALWEESLRAKHSGVAMTEQQMEFLLGSEGCFQHSPHLTQVKRDEEVEGVSFFS